MYDWVAYNRLLLFCSMVGCGWLVNQPWFDSCVSSYRMQDTHPFHYDFLDGSFDDSICCSCYLFLRDRTGLVVSLAASVNSARSLVVLASGV